MKQIALFLMGIVLSAGLSAQSFLASKAVNGPNFETLTVIGPVTVELIEADNASVQAQGNHQFIEGVMVSWQKKSLHISYTPAARAEGGAIRIFAKGVKTIVAEEGAKIVTPSPLNSPNIHLTVNGESLARVMTYGKIRVFTMGQVRMDKVTAKK